MGIKLVAATSDEQLQQVAELASSIWHEYFTAIISREQINYMLERFQSYQALQQYVKQENYQYFFIKQENELVGYTGVKQEDGKLFLSKLYLLKEHRGNGYGGAAIDELKQLAEQQHLASIWLTVNRYNDSTIAMYKHKGFIVVREQVADIGNGFVMDDYIMELSL